MKPNYTGRLERHLGTNGDFCICVCLKEGLVCDQMFEQVVLLGLELVANEL